MVLGFDSAPAKAVILEINKKFVLLIERVEREEMSIGV